MIALALMRLILASGSPRRRMLLEEMGYDFDIVVPEVVEDFVAGESPEEHVLRLSRKKAELVASDYPDDLTLGADTIVVLGDRIFGKPKSEIEAREMLETLSGKTHIVYTGVAIINRSGGIALSRYDSTRVTFNVLKDEQIDNYIGSGEPMDKAGAYGIQGPGSYLVERYDGAMDTVIGFPRRLFEEMYREVISCQ